MQHADVTKRPTRQGGVEEEVNQMLRILGVHLGFLTEILSESLTLIGVSFSY